jgi:hypothetical protein
MEEHHAGGRNTHTQSSPAEKLLESGLAEVAGAVADLLAQARAIDPKSDTYGHARSRAYTDAVQLLKVSAKLGHTVAELRGTKFEHTISVRREIPAKPVRGNVTEVVEEPEYGIRQYKGHDYNPNTRFLNDKVFVRGLGKMHVPDDWDEERWKAGLPQKWEEEGAPPAISGGSNGNFEAAETAVPRIRSL